MIDKTNVKGKVPLVKLSQKIIKDIKNNYKLFKGNNDKKKKKKILKERNTIERLIDYKTNKISHYQSALIQLENQNKIKALEKINSQVCLNHIDFLESKMHLNYGTKSNFLYVERQEVNKKLNNDSYVYVNN